MASKKKYYAVANGRTRGIFTQWFGDAGAEKQVRGFPGAVYKGFTSQAAAEAFLKERPQKPMAGKRARTSKKSTPRAKTSPRNRGAFPQPKGDEIIMYTDGGAIYNPGPGGYGVVIINDSNSRELSKGYRHTTNNRMELLACIVGLDAIKKPASIILHSDSKYVINGITKGWAKRWQANNWMRTKTQAALNPDLWERLLKLCDKHDVQFLWVKGHAGIAGNERCDELATRAATGSNLAVDTIFENTTQKAAR